MLPPSQFSYRTGLGTCNALLILFHCLQVALDRGVEEKLVQLNFLTVFDRGTAICCIS